MTFKTTRESPPLKVLLAEDDALIRELVAHYLTRLGCDVFEAPDGAVALALLEDPSSQPFDLIVTDRLMPKASGETVMRQAKAMGACNRFLLMSGDPVAPEEKKTMESEDLLYIEKPFTFGDFEAKLQLLATGHVAQNS